MHYLIFFRKPRNSATGGRATPS